MTVRKLESELINVYYNHTPMGWSLTIWKAGEDYPIYESITLAGSLGASIAYALTTCGVDWDAAVAYVTICFGLEVIDDEGETWN